MDVEIDVPPFFICPISMDVMKDPVTLATGITYDRESIDKWLSISSTCPLTKQVLTDTEVTPNHTVRRLIQAWCTINASYGVERFPTPKPLITKTEIIRLINLAQKSRSQLTTCLQKLRCIVSEKNTTNKPCLEAAGVVQFLGAVINDQTEEILTDDALAILYNLQVSESGIKNLVSNKNGTVFIDSLIRVMKQGSDESRAYSIFLLNSVLEIADPIHLINLKSETFTQVVRILRDQISLQATKTALEVLISVCSWGRNRFKAVESNAVSVLIELLLDQSFSDQRRLSEMAMTLLETMCQCADGRSEFLKHGAGVAVVSKKILRVSKVTSERGVKILYNLGKYCATPSLLHDMVEIGVVNKLFLVLQVECGSRTQEKARELLRLHARVWKTSPCLSSKLVVSYPS